MPAARGKSTRLELRSPAPSCNPYLPFAAILAAGVDGIKNKINPDNQVDVNIFELNEKEREELGIDTLPGTLKKAANYLENDAVLKEALGEHVHDNILRIARADWEAYRVQVYDWEIMRYLDAI